MIKYEWCYETIEDGDITENDFEDKLEDFTDDRKTNQLCLIRNEGDEINGLEDRLWAYVVNGKLPDLFSDSNLCEISIKVPEKFKKELVKYLQ